MSNTSQWSPIRNLKFICKTTSSSSKLWKFESGDIFIFLHFREGLLIAVSNKDPLPMPFLFCSDERKVSGHLHFTIRKKGHFQLYKFNPFSTSRWFYYANVNQDHSQLHPPFLYHGATTKVSKSSIQLY